MTSRRAGRTRTTRGRAGRRTHLVINLLWPFLKYSNIQTCKSMIQLYFCASQIDTNRYTLTSVRPRSDPFYNIFFRIRPRVWIKCKKQHCSTITIAKSCCYRLCACMATHAYVNPNGTGAQLITCSFGTCFSSCSTHQVRLSYIHNLNYDIASK